MTQMFIGSAVFASMLLTSTSVGAVGITGVPNPRHANVWVTDMADMIDPDLESTLNALIAAAHNELSIEIAVVTVGNVDTATPKEFATDLFNYWGIGKSATNNGLLVLMVKDQRRLEMETGYGLESALTDGWLKRIQTNDMVPYFKQGEFGQGLFTGVSASIDRVRSYHNGTASEDHPVTPLLNVPAPTHLRNSSNDSNNSGNSNVPLWLIGIATSMLFLGGGARYLHRRERTCCKQIMTMLPEDEDDIHLSSGQIAEERVGSVDWQFYYCESCGNHTLLRVAKWFSGYKPCKSCGFKTLEVSEVVTSSPSYTSSGTAEITEKCMHCGVQHVSHRTLPQLYESSSDNSSSGGSSSSYGGGSSGGSSSSGGGSSFGGGSSGGGGAGSSW